MRRAGDPGAGAVGAVSASSLFALALAVPIGALAGERANYFNDPFVQVTAGLPGCPVPEGPLISESQMHTEAHSRAERGTRCYLSGACRLPNSYLYDKDIVARVKRHVVDDGRFAATSVWVLGQRRWVTLKGCVRTKAQSAALERRVHEVDDVESVVNELMVGTRGTPKYRTAESTAH
jgi:BON domain-containing protein